MTQRSTSGEGDIAQRDAHQLRRGTLGVLGIAFFVVSAAAPLTAMAGGAPVAMLLGNGPGIPLAYVVVSVILLIFAVGTAGSLGPAGDSPPMNHAEAGWLPSETDILGHRSVRDQVHLLIHRTYSESLGGFRRVWIDFHSVQPDASRISWIDAGQSLDQGAFARSIFPHQRVDFPASNDKIDILQGLDSWEVLRESANLEHYFCRVVHYGSIPKLKA